MKGTEQVHVEKGCLFCLGQNWHFWPTSTTGGRKTNYVPPMCSSTLLLECIFSGVTIKLDTADVNMDEAIYRKVLEENLLEVTKD